MIILYSKVTNLKIDETFENLKSEEKKRIV